MEEVHPADEADFTSPTAGGRVLSVVSVKFRTIDERWEGRVNRNAVSL